MKQYKLNNLLITEMSWQEYKTKKNGKSIRNKQIKSKDVLECRCKIDCSKCDKILQHNRS